MIDKRSRLLRLRLFLIGCTFLSLCQTSNAADERLSYDFGDIPHGVESAVIFGTTVEATLSANENRVSLHETLSVGNVVGQTNSGKYKCFSRHTISGYAGESH